MKYNFIQLNSDELISLFMERDQTCFDIEDVYNEYPNNSKGSIRQLLRDMTKRGKVSRIKEGLYVIVPLGKKHTTYIPEWHTLSEHLVETAEHYIGYYLSLIHI